MAGGDKLTRQYVRTTPEEIGKWIEYDLVYNGDVKRLSQATGYTPKSVRRWLKAARLQHATISATDTNG